MSGISQHSVFNKALTKFNDELNSNIQKGKRVSKDTKQQELTELEKGISPLREKKKLKIEKLYTERVKRESEIIEEEKLNETLKEKLKDVFKDEIRGSLGIVILTLEGHMLNLQTKLVAINDSPDKTGLDQTKEELTNTDEALKETKRVFDIIEKDRRYRTLTDQLEYLQDLELKSVESLNDIPELWGEEFTQDEATQYIEDYKELKKKRKIFETLENEIADYVEIDENDNLLWSLFANLNTGNINNIISALKELTPLVNPTKLSGEQLQLKSNYGELTGISMKDLGKYIEEYYTELEYTISNIDEIEKTYKHLQPIRSLKLADFKSKQFIQKKKDIQNYEELAKFIGILKIIRKNLIKLNKTVQIISIIEWTDNPTKPPYYLFVKLENEGDEVTYKRFDYKKKKKGFFSKNESIKFLNILFMFLREKYGFCYMITPETLEKFNVVASQSNQQLPYKNIQVCSDMECKPKHNMKFDTTIGQATIITKTCKLDYSDINQDPDTNTPISELLGISDDDDFGFGGGGRKSVKRTKKKTISNNEVGKTKKNNKQLVGGAAPKGVWYVYKGETQQKGFGKNDFLYVQVKESKITMVNLFLLEKPIVFRPNHDFEPLPEFLTTVLTPIENSLTKSLIKKNQKYEDYMEEKSRIENLINEE